MNDNQGKQILLPVVAIALFIVAVIGVSFAFFTYSRTGSQNNVITAGRVTFVFEDGEYISLTNHFPIAGETGISLSGDNEYCTFSIAGNTVAGNIINYAVWAIPGDVSSSEVFGSNYNTYTTKFRDSEIFVHISKNNGGVAFTSATNNTQGSALSTLAQSHANVSNPTNGRLLGYGTVSGMGSDVYGNFTVRMWVDSSVVTICDTGCTYTPNEYDHMYYTMKIAITASQ